MTWSDKSLDCLWLASVTKDGEGWSLHYQELCQKWGEKVVIRKMERLADRGYIEYGVSPRTGWLTEKGKHVLEANRCRFTA